MHRTGRFVVVMALLVAWTACDRAFPDAAAFCGRWLDDRYFDPRYEACYGQFEAILHGCEIYDALPPGCELTNHFECLTIHSSCIQGVATLDLLACAPLCDPGNAAQPVDGATMHRTGRFVGVMALLVAWTACDREIVSHQQRSSTNDRACAVGVARRQPRARAMGRVRRHRQPTPETAWRARSFTVAIGFRRPGACVPANVRRLRFWVLVATACEGPYRVERNVDRCNDAFVVLERMCDVDLNLDRSWDCNAFGEERYPEKQCDATPYFDCLVDSAVCDDANDTVIVDTFGCAPLLACVDK